MFPSFTTGECLLLKSAFKSTAGCEKRKKKNCQTPDQTKIKIRSNQKSGEAL